jgi:hypothetical protein
MPGHPAYSVRYAIADAGNDLERARVFDFYLFFPSERAAEQAALELEEVGFCCNIQPGQGTDWLCLAAARVVPSEAGLAALRHLMETTAEDFGGDFDRWETRHQVH